MRNMFAKFPGTCRDCQRTLPKGAQIAYHGRGAGISCATACKAAPREPDGTCWACKSAPGFFRNRGAAAPVWCDACNVKLSANDFRNRDHSSHEDRACGDTAYEDACARACGL